MYEYTDEKLYTDGFSMVDRIKVKNCNSMPFWYGVGCTIRCKCGCQLARHRP